MRRLLPLAFLSLIVVAGCGGSAHTIGSAPKTERQPGLLNGTGAANSSAGTVVSYKPTGSIVADDGFRPWVDGFAFENYGNDVDPENMTAKQVADLFGNQVCARGAGTSCRLTPVAQQWMADENARMSGGHCMGFSVTALEFYDGFRDPKTYGAKKVFSLPIRNNLGLQELLAENWVFQDLPSIANRRVVGTPNVVLQKLMSTLNDSNGELYTVAIFKRDGTGGHAVTPFAVEDRGGGKFAILIYDNNFPGVIRAIKVNAKANTWSYIGGPDPSDTNELYDGDAKTQSLFLLPTSPGFNRQPCPFCKGIRGRNSASAGSTLAPSKQYDQLSLIGNPANHGHLILHDDAGRVTGFVHDHVVNNIPGVRVQTTITSQNWNVAPEPTYLIPPKTAVSVTVDGSGLTKPDKERIDLIGPGLYAQVDDLMLRPNEVNTIDFRTGATGFVFHTDPHHDQTPVLDSAIQERKTAYAFAAIAVGVKGGSKLTMYIDQKTGELVLDTRGTIGSIAGTGLAVYVLSVVRETPQGDSVWVTGKLLLKRGELAVVDYRHAPAANKPLTIITGTAAGKDIEFQKAPPQKTK
ncbi:MAG TPA: hypothetical protein VLJ76_01285 [Gaiellaceae bacterium]|nr:hypothetical protein [Gaiellaceae bacterium]